MAGTSDTVETRLRNQFRRAFTFRLFAAAILAVMALMLILAGIFAIYGFLWLAIRPFANVEHEPLLLVAGTSYLLLGVIHVVAYLAGRDHMTLSAGRRKVRLSKRTNARDLLHPLPTRASWWRNALALLQTGPCYAARAATLAQSLLLLRVVDSKACLTVMDLIAKSKERLSFADLVEIAPRDCPVATVLQQLGCLSGMLVISDSERISLA